MSLSVSSIPAQVAFHVWSSWGEEFGHRQNELFPAASVIKVGILLEFLRQCQEGRIDPGERVSVQAAEVVGGAGVLCEFDPGLSPTWMDLSRLMIVVSDNTASNLLLRRLGMEHLNECFAKLGVEACFGREFMEPATPVKDNRMTAEAGNRLLRYFLSEDYLDSSWRGRGLEILKRQQFREKIPARLPDPEAVAHKTGELDGVRHDSAIVYHPRGPFCLTILTQEGAEAWKVDNAIGAFALEVYEQLS